MTDAIVIDDDVPLPARSGGRGKGALLLAFEDMEAGQSFFAPLTAGRISGTVSRMRKNFPEKKFRNPPAEYINGKFQGRRAKIVRVPWGGVRENFKKKDRFPWGSW